MLVLPPLVLKPLKANHTCGIFLLFANLQPKKEYKNKTTTCGIFLLFANLQPKKEYKNKTNKTTTCGIFLLFTNLQPEEYKNKTTRSSWLNCKLRGDAAEYWASKGQQWLVLGGIESV